MGGSVGSLFDGSLANNAGQGQFQAERYNIDRGAFDPNADEQAFVKALQARAAGTAPSAAQMQMQAGLDSSIQNANALAASQSAINPALAARLAQQSAAQGAGQVNQQGAILRAQEQQQAEGALGGALESQRAARMNREALGVSQQTGMNAVNAQSFEGSQNRRGAMINNIGRGAASFGMMNQGGMVPGYAMGGQIPAMQSAFAQALAQMQSQPSVQLGKVDDSGDAGAAIGKALGKLKSNGSPEQASTAGSVQSSVPTDGAGAGQMMVMSPMGASDGAIVPGKAKVSHDDEVNDTVPAMLSPGEMVIPRTVVQDGPEAIRAFAKAILKKGMPS